MQFQSGLCFKQSKWSYNASVVPETIAAYSQNGANLRAPLFFSLSSEVLTILAKFP